jgi:UDP-N-acetylmuramoyl-L-alanyl-D-glutamate--2,6-diaminopimelate ligase
MNLVPPPPKTVEALRRVLAGAGGDVRVVGAAGTTVVTGLSDDSRTTAPGQAFFARPGSKTDGIAFARAAIARGASVVVAREPVAEDVPGLLVPDVDAALRDAADAWFGRPQDALDLVGITGTKGKTTTSWIARAALAAAGRRAAVLGTISYDVGDGVRREAANTTPGALELRRLLADARDAGATACVMEVSSHALDQGRTAGLAFRVGVLTNLASDHLDYHKTPDAYFEAKARLFAGLARSSTAVLNRDDPSWARFAERARCRTLTYGGAPECDLRATKIELGAEGTSFRLSVGGEAVVAVRTPLVGRHNVSNFLAAVGAVTALGVDPVTAVEGASTLVGVRGRLERVEPSGDLHVFVDYAHTEDALRQVLGFLRTVGALPLTCVFGCGGDRDRTKRPLMGAVAGRLSDVVVVTSDNPRTEDPAAIIDEVLRGIPGASARGARPAAGPEVLTIVDRREAIGRAVERATSGDLVIVAGKGHEKTQVIGSRQLPFDDVAVSRDALNRRRSRERVGG